MDMLQPDGTCLSALPRIGVRPATSGSTAGQFYDTSTGESFVPRGYNYIDFDAQGMSDTFAPGRYDRDAVNAALSRMQADGFNAVRVFIDHRGPIDASGASGIGGPYATVGLYQPYVDNVIDFLRLATDHHIYVVITFSYLPINAHYDSILYANIPANVEGFNVYYLSPGGVAGKVDYSRRMLQAVAAVDGGRLLATVLWWDLFNEVHLRIDQKPFSLSAGSVQTADYVTYDLSSAADRQQCIDSNTLNWANQAAASIRAVDPAALVTASVFTYAAVGKVAGHTGPCPSECTTPGACAPPCGDMRVPARPRVLRAYSTLSFTNFHLYRSSTTYDLLTDLESSEFSAFDRTVAPLAMGEYGAWRSVFPASAASAALPMQGHRDQARMLGFYGSLYWTFDTTEQTDLWHAVEEGGAINHVLSPGRVWRSYDASHGEHSIYHAGFSQPGYTVDQAWSIRVITALNRRAAMHPLYLCVMGSDYFISKERGCEGGARVEAQAFGWIHDDYAPGRVRVDRCQIGGQRFHSVSVHPFNQTCEGQGFELALGFSSL